MDKLQTLVYIVNSVKVTISHDSDSKVAVLDLINNTKLGLMENNQFNFLIWIQDLIQNGFKLLQRINKSSDQTELGIITPTLDLGNILSGCDIMQSDFDSPSLKGDEIGRNTSEKSMPVLTP